MRASGYAKDNRLLPRGWRDDGPFADVTSPVGTTGDGDFQGGRDDVEIRLRLPASSGPYVLEAELLYQTLGARFAAELLEHRTPEVVAFQAAWEAADRRP